MSKFLRVAAIAAFCSATPAAAQVLTTGVGDGKVTVGVGANGAFGSSTGVPGATNAVYDPVGAIPAAGTTFESYLYLRTAAANGTFSGARLNLGTVAATTTATSLTSTSSVFSSGALLFNLTQSVTDLLDNTNSQTGSLLTQAYTITNSSADALQIELTRYFDGDLAFNGSISDGGGRLISGGREILFELDSATGASTGTTFVGIYNEGANPGGYEIDSYSGLRSNIAAGTALDGIIAGDSNADGFIDSGYDVTLGLAGLRTLQAGQSFTFTTSTIFGSGAPGQIVVPPIDSGVPEPTTWAMMMLGFGGMGYAMRRRQKVSTHIRFA